MNKMISAACIGQGFVGSSLAQVLAERGINVYAFDVAGKKAPGTNPKQFISIKHMIEVCESDDTFSGVVFLCVPTPMVAETGECDLSIVKNALNDIAKAATKEIVVVCKSTMPPGSTASFNEMLVSTNVKVCHSPEFLRELTALDDMRNQNRIVIGGSIAARGKARVVFAAAFPNVPILLTNSTTSEMVKYFTNVQLAARIVLSCEFHEICEKLSKQGHDIDYSEVVRISSADKRLGGSHMSVPGHDGIMGARGHCFPKDLAALVHMTEKLGIVNSVLKAIQTKNLAIVPSKHRDWEKMVGRAFVKRKKPVVNVYSIAKDYIARNGKPFFDRLLGTQQ